MSLSVEADLEEWMCMFFWLVVTEALWSESAGLMSQRGGTQPNILWKERKREYLSVCIINTDVTSSHLLESHLHGVVVGAYMQNI